MNSSDQLIKQVFASKDQKTPAQRSQIVHARKYVIFLFAIISLHDERNTHSNSIHGKKKLKRKCEFVEFGMQLTRSPNIAIYTRTFFSYIHYSKLDPVYSVFRNMRNSCAHNTWFSPFSSANVINCITRCLTYAYFDYKLHRIRNRIHRNETNECFQSRRFRQSSIACVQISSGEEFFTHKDSSNPIPPTRSISLRVRQRNYNIS